MAPLDFLTPEFNNLEFRQLDELLAPICELEIIFERNSDDHFSIRSAVKNPNGSPVSNDDLLITTPLGGNWVQSVGKVSYFAIPFTVGENLYVSIGLETVIRHPSRRTFPVSRAYGFSLSHPNAGLEPALMRLMSLLHGSIPKAFTTSMDDIPQRGELRRRANQPDLDAAMLARAVPYLLEGRPYFLRTLLLAPSLHPKQLNAALGTAEQLQSCYVQDDYLVGIEHNARGNRGRWWKFGKS